MIPILTYSDEMDKLRKRKGRKKDSTYYYLTLPTAKAGGFSAQPP